MSKDATLDIATNLSDDDKSYFLLRAAAESSSAAQADNPVVSKIHIILALAYLHRVLGREDDYRNDAGLVAALNSATQPPDWISHSRRVLQAGSDRSCTM